MNAITEQINAMGKAFVGFGWPMLIQSSVLILILLLADFALRRKVRAVLRYWVWMLVLVKLMLPASLSSPVGLGQFFGDRLEHPNLEWPASTGKHENIPPAPVSTETPRRPLEITEQAEPPTSQAAPEIPIASLPAERAEPTVAPTAPVTWQGLVFLVWLAVVVGMGLLLLQRALFVRGLVAQAKNANRLMEDALQLARKQMGVRARIRLKVSANATSPAVCGLFRPVILVPNNLAPSLGSRHLRAVLLHELAHIKRGDLWVNLVQTILQIIYFYNPLLWLANAVIRRVREQAVDEAVLVAMGERAQRYPETLVSVAKLAFDRPALSLRLIGVVESKNALAGRIKRILNRPTPKTARLGIVGLLVVFITAATLLPMAKAEKTSTIEPGTSGEADQQQRVRELVYVLRNSVIGSRIDEWAAAIKELVEVGAPTVPELVAELDRTERGTTIRALAFTLRAINDARAVPALIRALPKSSAGGSDCGLQVSDPNLFQFMSEHQIDPKPRPFELGFSYGRAVREVTSALEAITGHSEGHEHFHAHDSNDNRLRGTYEITPEIADRQKEYRQAVAERWQVWWDEHWSEFVTEEQLSSVAKVIQEDLVEAAGVAKFGVAFPTGQEVKLSPVKELVLPPSTFWDAKAFLDLETGGRFSNREGALPENRYDFGKWCMQVGVDVWARRTGFEGKPLFKLGGWNMHTWQVGNSRWDSFEEEVKGGLPIDLGAIGPRDDFLPIDPVTREFQNTRRPVTFLLTTVNRESGILQITSSARDANGVRIRYRLIDAPEQHAKREPRPATIYKPELGEAGFLGPVIDKVVRSATSDADSALDLDTGRLAVPPAEIRYPSLSKELLAWLDNEGSDVIAVPKPDGRLTTLTTFDMKVVSVSPGLWNSASPDQVAEMLWSAQSSRQSGMYVGGGTIPETYPVFFLFQTRQGGMGILQITGLTLGNEGIKIRYKMVQKGATEQTNDKPGGEGARAGVEINIKQTIKHEGKQAVRTGRFRHFVMLVVGKGRMTFEGEQVTWEQLPHRLEEVSHRDQTVLTVAVASDEMTLAEKNQAVGRATALQKQFGFESFSYVGVHPLGSKGGPAHHILEGKLDFDPKIGVPLEAGTEEKPDLVKCEWISFERSEEQVKATLHLGLCSWPKAKWEFRVLLRDAKDRPLSHNSSILTNSGIIVGFPVWSEEELQFELGKWSDISGAVRFELQIRELPAPAKKSNQDASMIDMEVKAASEHKGEREKGIERTDRKIISSAGNKVKSTEDFLTAFAPGSELVVQNINGSITVNGKEKAECRIEANIEVKAKNKEEAKRLLEKVEIKVASLGKKLAVKVHQPKLRSRESVTVDFEITVPSKAALALHTNNGSLDIGDITGKIEAKTNNGAISTVKTAGQTRLHTNNGKVTVSKADLKPGEIGVNNGEIRCTQITGDIIAKVNNGKVRVAYAKTAPNICDVSITTDNGAIDFTGPVNLSAAVKAETQIGSIATNLPLTVKGWMGETVSGKLGKGEGKLHLKTSIGSIRIR